MYSERMPCLRKNVAQYDLCSLMRKFCLFLVSLDYGFNQEYEAFGKEVKRLFNVDMPFLTNPFRKLRVKVLHEGYNPQPEEKEPVIIFTLGLLKKLEDVCNKFAPKGNSKTPAVNSVWNPLPKINFIVAQRLLRTLQFPQVG